MYQVCEIKKREITFKKSKNNSNIFMNCKKNYGSFKLEFKKIKVDSKCGKFIFISEFKYDVAVFLGKLPHRYFGIPPRKFTNCITLLVTTYKQI